MRGVARKTGPVPVSDLVGEILDPVLRKRAGISVALVQSWEEIVGSSLAANSRPEKIQWPKRAEWNEEFEPAVLVVACDGMAALHIQHQSNEVIGRINAFLGFNAIGRVRIVQKPVQSARPAPRPKPAALRDDEARRLSGRIAGIEDDELRASLERLGRSVLGSSKTKR